MKQTGGIIKGNNWKTFLTRRGLSLADIPLLVEGLEAQVKQLHEDNTRLRDNNKAYGRKRKGDPALARSLKDWMASEGISQHQAAARLGITQGHLHAMANDKAKASPPLLLKIAKQLNKPVECLIERPKE